MHNKGRFANVMFDASLQPGRAALAILVLLLFLIFVFLFLTLTAQPAQAQTYRVIHNFTGGQDGAWPNAGLSMDRAGNLYGSSSSGGQYGGGNVYRLSPNGSDWTFGVLYSFQGGDDGWDPHGALTIGPYGIVYGTTTEGGTGGGTVFAVRPSANATTNVLSGWTDKVLYSFTGGSDGSDPSSDLVFDQNTAGGNALEENGAPRGNAELM